MAVKQRGDGMIQIPEYTSGCFKLYRIEQNDTKDYPVEKLKDTGYEIWYREISVFDKTRYQLEQGGKEVTMKICIPQYKEIDSKCICVIDGVQHLVYNATHVMDKNGNRETELTLIRPGEELEIHE